MQQPKSVDVAGLFECLERALAYLGVGSELHGCNGANVNIGDRGVRGLLQAKDHG